MRAVEALARFDSARPLALFQDDLKVSRGILNAYAQRWAELAARLVVPHAPEHAFPRAEGHFQRDGPLIEVSKLVVWHWARSRY